MRLPAPQLNWDGPRLIEWALKVQKLFNFGSFTWTPPVLFFGTSVDTTITDATHPQLAGLKAGQHVQVTPPSTLNAGVVVACAFCPSDNALLIRLYNSTGGIIAPSAGEWSFAGVTFQ